MSRSVKKLLISLVAGALVIPLAIAPAQVSLPDPWEVPVCAQSCLGCHLPGRIGCQ